MPEEQAVDLRWLLAVVRRWWWLIVSCALLGGISALVVTAWMPPVYSATATLLIQPARDSGMSDYQTVLTGERMAQTYAQMMQEASVLEAAAERAQLREPLAALAGRIKAEPIPDTQLIRLSVRAGSATRAALLANAIAETFVQRIEASQAERSTDSLTNLESQMLELLTQIEATEQRIKALDASTAGEEQTELAHLEDLLAGYRSTYATLLQNYEQMRLTTVWSTQTVAIAEAARPPENPVQNRPLYVAVAGLVGAIVGLGAAFLLEGMDDTIKTPNDVRRTLGLKVLGIISRMSKLESGLIVTAQPQSAHTEAFRILCSNAGFYGEYGLPRTILVTSPTDAEGKSLISANLAMIPAQTGLRVVAVDADLRRPTLGRFFDLDPQSPGLSRVLQTGSIDGLLRPTPVEQLAILPSGALPADPASLFGSPHLPAVLDELAQQADVILIDGPPMLAVADTGLIAPKVDGVLLVVRAGRTQREAARSATENLAQVGARVIGVVLNDVNSRNSVYHSSYHRYKGAGRIEQLPPPEQAQEGAPDGIEVGPAAEGELVTLAPQAEAGPAWGQPIADIAPSVPSIPNIQDAEARAGATADHLPSGPETSPGEKLWEAEYESFAQRDLSEVQVEYLFLDALHKPLTRRRGDELKVPCAWAIIADGRKVLLHVASCYVESYEMWSSFLHDMMKRGLSVPVLAVGNGTSGVMRAVGEVFPKSLHQRCLVHRIRTVSDEIPKSARAEVRPMVQAAYYAPNPQLAERISTHMMNLYSTQYLSAMSLFRSDWETCIAYMRCPPIHHSAIRSTTFLQRSFAKERRGITNRLRTLAETGILERVFALLWQSSQRWQAIRMGQAERAQLRLLRGELGLLDG